MMSDPRDGNPNPFMVPVSDHNPTSTPSNDMEMSVLSNSNESVTNNVDLMSSSNASPQFPEKSYDVGTGGMDESQNRDPAAFAMTSDVADKSLWGSVTSCCSFDTLRSYFDVNTADIQRRIYGSVMYFNVREGLHEKVLVTESGQRGTPDAYGPFWIATTLVFFLAVTSNISMYLHSDNSESFEYDVSHLARAMVVLYTFAFMLPVAFFIVFRLLSVQMALMDLVSLYGYSLVPFLPATALCVIPNNIVEWLLLTAATTVSGIFVLSNVIVPVRNANIGPENSMTSQLPILGPIIGCHYSLLLVLKLGFYRH